MTNTLIISDTQIKERTAMHDNIDPKLIYPDIKVAQDMFIAPTLGTALFNKLQTLIEAGTTAASGNEYYKRLLDEYIPDALMYYVMSELVISLSYQMWNKGVMRKQSESAEVPSKNELDSLSSMYKNRAEFYLDRLKLYLIEYASTRFPEYLNPGNAADTMFPEKTSFTMPVYLGDEDNPYCNKGGFTQKPYSE